MSRKESMLAMLRREASAIHMKMMALEKIPDMDVYGDGAMIRVKTSSSLTYLLLKVYTDETPSSRQHRWYATGDLYSFMSSEAKTTRRYWMTWDEITSWLASVGVESWEELEVKSEMRTVDVTTQAAHLGHRDVIE